jgi:hypothetical protein
MDLLSEAISGVATIARQVGYSTELRSTRPAAP